MYTAAGEGGGGDVTQVNVTLLPTVFGFVTVVTLRLPG